MNALNALYTKQHQAVWLDFVSRGFVADGSLKTLVERDGIRGVTSNPAIFEKAISGSQDYLPALRAALTTEDRTVSELYEELAVTDIRSAADALLPVYTASGGSDGFVSLEVSPILAHDVEATVAEALRLHARVARTNLMVKVPATPAGIHAIRRLTAAGVSINATLLFSVDTYQQVASAFIEGLAAYHRTGGDVARVASVASFFVSRIDSVVDDVLGELKKNAATEQEIASLTALQGKAAIANAKLAYQSFKRMFASKKWAELAAAGARPQRLLWASTGTKNESYSDVLYVEELIGPDTVNTMPPATMDAFRDHGIVRATLEHDVGESAALMARLAQAGIDIEAVATRLLDEGVQLFVEAADNLIGALANQRTAILGARLDTQALHLTPTVARATQATITGWQKSGAIRRLWARDAGFWTGADEDRWLGWLDVIDTERAQLADYAAFSEDVRQRGFSDVVVLGMGGSSLGPEVLAQTYGQQQGFPKLRVLDSTHPDEVYALEQSLDLRRTLFIVASKSGSTLEPNLFRDYFLTRMKALVGAAAGTHFVAVTDPGSAMEKTALADGFWRVFRGVPQVGGRYSVLSAFGLVPAAAMGLDAGAIIETAAVMMRTCGADVPPASNPAMALGVALAEAALNESCDKVTFIASPAISPFGAWAEQLIAESTGKQGKALIPVEGEPVGAPAVYGEDRFFVYLRLSGDADVRQDEAVRKLENEGYCVARIQLDSIAQLPQEFFRFEMATAAAGAVLGINPFDQPDVEASKVETRMLVDAAERTGALPPEIPLFEDEDFAIYADPLDAVLPATTANRLEFVLRAHLRRVNAGDYVALLAYVPRSSVNDRALQRARLSLRDRYRVATCVEFGPRFLHSTGQAYKGGPASGVFIQITATPSRELPLPGRRIDFSTVVAAQARGDLVVLTERGRRAVRIHIKGADTADGLRRIADAVEAALA